MLWIDRAVLYSLIGYYYFKYYYSIPIHIHNSPERLAQGMDWEEIDLMVWWEGKLVNCDCDRVVDRNRYLVPPSTMNPCTASVIPPFHSITRCNPASKRRETHEFMKICLVVQNNTTRIKISDAVYQIFKPDSARFLHDAGKSVTRKIRFGANFVNGLGLYYERWGGGWVW